MARRGCCLLAWLGKLGDGYSPTMNVSHVRKAIHRYWRDYPGELSPDMIFVPSYVFEEFLRMREIYPDHYGRVEDVLVEQGDDERAIYVVRPDGRRWKYTGS